MRTCQGNKYLHIPGEGSMGILLPQMPFSPVFQSHSFQVNGHPIHWLWPMKQWTTTHLGIYPSKQNVWTCILPELRPTVKSSLYQCLLGFSYTGIITLQQFTFRLYLYVINKLGPSFFFSSQLLLGHTAWVYRCMLGSRWHCNRSRNHRL